MEFRVNWSYRRYLTESCKGILTAWSRIPEHWDEIRDGAVALLCAVVLLLLPLLLPFAPLLALLARVSDRKDAKRAKEARERMMKERFNIWKEQP